MKPRILGIIPARYASTRFPAKPLVDIAGKSMIRRVYEQCQKSEWLTDVVVATDHAKIMAEVASFGGKAVMTAQNHPSGTDRCFEALQKSGKYDFAINIQGDEPFIQPNQIDLLAQKLQDSSVQIATLVNEITQSEEITNPNVVKALIGQNSNALYFSRSPIPYIRGEQVENWLGKHTFYRHLGIYAFRADVLEAITQLPVGKLEMAESLEQLRWLEAGYQIKIGISPYASVGIDTPEDLEKILKEMAEEN